MANLPALRVFLTADTNKYNKGMTKAQLTAKKFANGIKKTAATMIGFAGAITGGVMALNRFAQIGDDIGKGAKKIGVTAEEFQKLGFAARRSGADIGNINTAFKRMASTIFDANNGLAESKRALQAMGLSAEQLKGKRPEQQFAEIAAALSKVADESTKAALAQDVFGRSGTELIPMLANYKALAAEAEQLGLITNENVAAAEKYKDTMEDLAQTIRAEVVNSGLLPWLNDVIEGFAALDELGRGELTHRRGAATPAELRQQRAAAQARRDLAQKKKEAAEEKKYASIIRDARAATAHEFKKRVEMNKMSEQVFGGFNQILSALTGDMQRIDTFLDPEFEDGARGAGAGATTADGRSTMLAQALQAGSREAFGLLVKGREADTKKTAKNNLKANEDTAMGVGIIATQGVKLQGVATLNSFK